ncbi:MAG: glycosyltransferase family 1 protein [Rhodospirillales bacterium]|nr:MAG: glycosyltransferase family 1 protein [Rhodospirillales bacterium]
MNNNLVGINWVLSSFHGWGILGVNLTLGLLKAGRLPVPLQKATLSLPDEESRRLQPALDAGQEIRALMTEGNRFAVGFPVIQPVSNALRWDEEVAGSPDLGITFFENTCLDADALARGKSLQRLITGCRWADGILRDKGFTNTAVCYQGVDPGLYFPKDVPRTRFPGRFVVFSGGKLEFRKGQDIALEGFRRFQARHPDALLLTAWQNPWPKSASTIRHGRHSKTEPKAGRSAPLDIEGWVQAHGLPAEAHCEIGFVAHGLLPDLLRQADAALFTSRAESGTNLMAMEALALGLPTILSANTGHLDLIDALPCLALRQQTPIVPRLENEGVDGWGESDPDEIAARLEEIYDRGQDMRALGLRAAEIMRDWSWEKRMDQMIDALGLGMP